MVKNLDLQDFIVSRENQKGVGLITDLPLFYQIWASEGGFNSHENDKKHKGEGIWDLQVLPSWHIRKKEYSLSLPQW